MILENPHPGAKTRPMPESSNPEWVAVGKRLKLIELAEGKNGNQIAADLEIDRRNWSKYKKGQREFPIPLAANLKRLCGATLEWIYLGEEADLKDPFRAKLTEARRKARAPKAKPPKNGSL
jgi:transcriptional regulator with XRE-family HTH domain